MKRDPSKWILSKKIADSDWIELGSFEVRATAISAMMAVIKRDDAALRDLLGPEAAASGLRIEHELPHDNVHVITVYEANGGQAFDIVYRVVDPAAGSS